MRGRAEMGVGLVREKETRKDGTGERDEERERRSREWVKERKFN